MKNSAVKNQEVKVTTIIGTKMNAEGTTKLHTAICDCGHKIVRGSKKESLNYFIEKQVCKECGSHLHYAGELEFLGNEIIKQEEVNGTDNTESAQTLIDINTLIKPGKKGVTNFQMIPAIKENIEKPENLRALFNAYEEVFIGSSNYLKDSHKLIVQDIIREKQPEFIVPMLGKKSLEKVQKMGA